MDNVLIIIVILFWVASSLYVMRWHYQRGDLDIGTTLLALTLGPILAIIIKQNKKEEENHTIGRHHYIEENDRHMRWFRTIGEINRQRIPNYGRTIPPPPPISRIERAQSERDEAIRSAIERIDKNKIKDFKFFKG